MTAKSIQKSLRSQRARARWLTVVLVISAVDGAQLLALGADETTVAAIGTLVFGSLVFARRADCPNCSANLWKGEAAPMGVRTRRVWFDPRGLPDRCSGCGLDLTEASLADFTNSGTKAAWAKRDSDRRAEARRRRSFG